MSLVSLKAPDFKTSAVSGTGEIINEYHFAEKTIGKPTLILFYPLDFTFVCPSELIALDHRMADFKKLGVEVLSVSIDSHFTHSAWRNTPVKEGGIGPVKFTMLADISHKIAKMYGVEHPEGTVAFRGTFIIDRHGVVRSEIINDLPLGRNMDELIRLFEAIEFYETHGEVCPANWKKGDKGMKPTKEGVSSYLAEHCEKG
jgi:peroxiredoxin (alkyl hydroperoxide reductase subunit C)